MWLIPEWAPNIHPMLVHFPLALLFFAVAMDLLSFFIPDTWWDETKTTVTYLVGGAFTVLVFFTGQAAADSIQIPKSAYQAVGEHAGWAEWTVWFFVIYALARLILSLRGSMKRTPVHVLMFAISLVGIFFLFETGEHGAELVFGHGLGTGTMVSEQARQPQSQMQSGGFVSDAEGSWTWIVGPNAPEVIKNRFSNLGSQSQFNVGTGADSTALLALPADSTFITTNKKYGDFQLELSAEFSSLQGELLVVHHLQDADNFDYMSLNPDGTVRLGRMRSGSRTVIEEGNAEWQQAKTLKFVNSGEHQRGYVDGELIVHGHVEEAPHGSVGLKPTGGGDLNLKRMDLSVLPEGEHEHAESEESHEHE